MLQRYNHGHGADRFYFSQSIQDVWPNLNHVEVQDLVRRRDAGDAEALQLLILQGLPWAFRLACKEHRYDTTMAIDLAVDASNAAAKYMKIGKYKLSTLIGKCIKWIKIKNYRRTTKLIQAQTLTKLTEEDVADHRERQERFINDKLESAISVFDHLRPREAHIMTLRGQGWTLKEIASVEGVSKERIRQLEQKAIRKIKWLTDPENNPAPPRGSMRCVPCVSC